MTILCSFSYYSFVKFYLKNGSRKKTVLYPNLCYNKVCSIHQVFYFEDSVLRLCYNEDGVSKYQSGHGNVDSYLQATYH